MNPFDILQMIAIREDRGPRIVARSDGVDFALEEAVLRLVVDFGARPAGLRCPAAVFATPLGTQHVAVVQVGDLHDDGDDPPLGFRILGVSSALFRVLCDPFAIADRFPVDFAPRGTLPILTWSGELPPRRTTRDLQARLKNGDGSLLLGSAQAILDGVAVLVVRSAPDRVFVRALWDLLPDAERRMRWPAEFAFAPILGFHAVVMPPPGPMPTAGVLSEEQAKDYPEGRYELALQAAVEAGDEVALDNLLSRRAGAEVLRTLVLVLLFAVILVIVLKFV